MPLFESRAQQIGNQISGFGAGLQGNLPQFQEGQRRQEQQQFQQQQAQQVQQQEMMKAREQSVYTDANASLELADMGDWDSVVQLGVNRLESAQQLSVEDMSGTQRLTQLALAARNGNEEAATLFKAEIGSKVNQGRALGLLDDPAAPKGATDLGKARQDLDSGLIDQAQYDGLADGILAGDEESAADQRERKVEQYQEFFDMSREEAIVAADSIFTTDANGNSILYNPIDGTSKLLTPSYGDNEGAPPQEYDPTDVEDLDIDVTGGTGAYASMLAMYNKTVGQLPFLPIAEGPEQAAQELRFLERDAIKALASSGRPPVIEQQRIMSVIPQALSFFENPEVAQLQTANFIDMMMQQYSDDMRFSKDPANPEDVRNSSRERSNQIEGIVRRLLKPDAANSMFNTTNKMIGADSRILEMSEEELGALDITELSDDELDLLEQRLTGN